MSSSVPTSSSRCVQQLLLASPSRSRGLVSSARGGLGRTVAPAPTASRSLWTSSPSSPSPSATERPSTSPSSSSSSSSVHASEIAHFTRLASQWWDPHGEFALLHAMNPVRIEFVRSKLDEVRRWEAALRAAEVRRTNANVVEKGKERASSYEASEGGRDSFGRTSFLEGLDVLDVGCGGGFLSEALCRLGARTTGIDAASSNIQIARAHASLDPALTPPATDAAASSSSLQYRDCTAETLRDEGAQFDVICAMEVVEHVRNPADFLRTLDGLLKPGGHLFLSTISRTPVAHFLTITMAEHILRLVSPGTHTYTQYIKPEEMVDFFVRSQDQGGLGWVSRKEGEMTGVPDRLKYEVRGAAYLPWKSAWQLADRNASPSWSQLANYFFWARKPL